MDETRRESLMIVDGVSDGEHARLVKMRKHGDLFYVPDPTSVYVCELEVTRDFSSPGSRHTWMDLYVSKAVAIHAACLLAKKWYDDRPYAKDMGDGPFFSAVAEERWDDALSIWEKRMSSQLMFKFRMVEVRRNPRPNEIVPPEESKVAAKGR